MRNFSTLQDANQQLQQWVLEVAGNRTHGSTFEKPLQQFTEIESKQLKSLPVTSPEIAVWHKVIPYKNCHVRYVKCYYSAPYQLYNKELWLKATATTITIYYQYEVVAIHARLFKAGEYSTNNAHLPPKAKAFLEHDGDWCRKQGSAIGVATSFVIETLLSDPTKDLIRAAQGIISLKSNYGSSRLELACRRAIYFNSISYRSIKTILTNELDYYVADIANVLEKPNAVYQGQGSFQRQAIKTV